MLLQQLIMSRPNLATRLLTAKGKKYALTTYSEALKLSAYKKFLADNGFDPASVKTIEDFAQVPVMDKDNFIKKYPLRERIKFPMPQNYTVERSSGYSGAPNYWVRAKGQDDSVGERIVTLLNLLFDLKHRKTLLINTFALGTWIAGTKVARWMLDAANKKELQMTTINVGFNLSESAEVIKNFYSDYDQVIVLGYNPFLKELLELLNESKFPFADVKFHLLMGGEGFSEEWRDYVAGLMGVSVDDYDYRILSGYGAADTGKDIGVEQPICVFFRRLLSKNPKLMAEIFGDDVTVPPMIFQYAPSSMWIEELEGELLFTANSGMPLVRYNLHDSGGILTYQQMIDIIAANYTGDMSELLKQLNVSPLPLVYLHGRSDGTVQLMGFNIYVEHIKLIMSMPQMQAYTTGKFYISVENDKNFNQKLQITFETKNIHKVEKDIKSITKLVMEHLAALNSEYNKVYNTDPSLVVPELIPVGIEQFAERSAKSLKVIYKK